MRLEISAKTNIGDDMFVNEIIVKTPGGKEVILDRNATCWTYDGETKEADVLWKEVYIWNPDGDGTANYDVPASLINQDNIYETEYDAEAPEGYYFEIIDVEVC